MKNTALALALLSLAACGTKITKEDAEGALRGVAAIASIEDIDPDQRTRIRYQLCSELKGCAAGCEEALSACVNGDPSQRAVLLASCFDDAKKARENQVDPDVWFEGYFDRFLDAARPLLDTAKQAELDAARKP